jgi:hypothetical protein
MARFASTKVKTTAPDTVNLAGGQAHTMSPKLAFASALLTTFTTDTFYKSAGDSVAYVADLAAKLDDPLFAAKAAVFTRKMNGLRSVSHIVAGELATRADVKGQPWLRRFYRNVVVRPDDITETMAYLKGKNPKLRSLSNALKRGFGDALSGFDAYQLAKYLCADRDPNLIDAVNLLHPRSTDALKALMTGTLKPADTWEVKMTQAGQKAKSEGLSESAKTEMKGQAWADLLAERKLGYLAVLRNLRNIADEAPTAMPLALSFLTDPRQVEKSKVFPFQLLTATEALAGSKANSSDVKRALNKAMDLSLRNVPEFEGPTLIAVDNSKSMDGRPIKIASLFAAAIFKAQKDADVVVFSADAAYIDLNPDDTLATMVEVIEKSCRPASTNFHSIFQRARRAYARVVILSDEQAWVGGHTPAASLASYRKRTQSDPRIFSFNLNSQDGTMQFPESKVYALAGFSDTVLGLMQNLEKDPQALVHEIEALEM